jgi:hypothetical protein
MSNITLNPTAVVQMDQTPAAPQPQLSTQQITAQLNATHISETNQPPQVPSFASTFAQPPTAVPTFATSFAPPVPQPVAQPVPQPMSLPPPINTAQYFPTMPQQMGQTSSISEQALQHPPPINLFNPSQTQAGISPNQINLQMPPATNFLQQFKLQENQTTLPAFNPDLLNSNPNQIVQNLVQQTISNHFQQLLQQQNLSHDGHGHLHDHGHGHSHSEGGCTGHGHSH